ncbi:FAS1-like dehydratase domain-containing protein [Noviherbaspirillum denitrificans]|uniref:Acyl-CoA dehydrogenase n=1 Tax=Noviherbaspirillum denitrificans TaxID=1968433 RepID=A0A254TH26_9BURK|nr:MaoC family dehydratase N-terminal domain-containing protein [Noviherbaspirillum denitrificans]OWW21961.1 acyl-CoA dehydrogenase [Noviherbaspirillum denitrificans]
MKIDGIDIPLLHQWVGKTESIQDVVHPALAAGMAAVLDRDAAPQAGEPLPPLWHWMVFWNTARQSELGHDGHAQRGKFLPPVPLPRRMWAGGRLNFLAPIDIGSALSRTSTIKAVDVKRGKSGDMVFVTVEHAISNADGIALVEEHDIVYRDAPQGTRQTQPVQAPSGATWTESVSPDPTLLFRYSALTFNGHRIHYDRSYATEVEGYPGLIVHGPLLATLLVELAQRRMPGAAIKSFSFRAVSPLFDIEPFEICGEPPDADGVVKLWAKNVRGELAMQAQAVLAM